MGPTGLRRCLANALRVGSRFGGGALFAAAGCNAVQLRCSKSPGVSCLGQRCSTCLLSPNHQRLDPRCSPGGPRQRALCSQRSSFCRKRLRTFGQRRQRACQRARRRRLAQFSRRKQLIRRLKEKRCTRAAAHPRPPCRQAQAREELPPLAQPRTQARKVPKVHRLARHRRRRHRARRAQLLARRRQVCGGALRRQPRRLGPPVRAHGRHLPTTPALATPGATRSSASATRAATTSAAPRPSAPGRATTA